jgi:hypothetical protein
MASLDSKITGRDEHSKSQIAICKRIEAGVDSARYSGVSYSRYEISIILGQPAKTYHWISAYGRCH